MIFYETSYFFSRSVTSTRYPLDFRYLNWVYRDNKTFRYIIKRAFKKNKELISIDKNKVATAALRSQMEAFAMSIRENDAEIVLMPLAGRLVDLLHLLRDNHIPYTTTHLDEAKLALNSWASGIKDKGSSQQ